MLTILVFLYVGTTVVFLFELRRGQSPAAHLNAIYIKAWRSEGLSRIFMTRWKKRRLSASAQMQRVSLIENLETPIFFNSVQITQ